MAWVFAGFLVVHGLIHLMGFAKAFGYAALPDLTTPISRAMGLAWLAAAALFLVAAVLVVVSPRTWWMVAGAAVLVSLCVVAAAWHDARFGALANVVVAVGIAFGVLTAGPGSLRARYEHDVRAALAARVPDARHVSEADLASLPPPVQRYLRLAGAVGRPRVGAVRARMRGRIRSARDTVWMPLSAEQYDVFGARPARLFYLTASRALVPIQGFHRFVDGAASMRIEAIGLVPVMEQSGPVATQAETVTLFNDICMLAPAALLDAPVTWLDAGTRDAAGRDVVRARYAPDGRAIEAALVFDQDGRLVDFVSDDRSATSPDGTTMVPRRWSTPLLAYRRFGTATLASRGEARWHEGVDSWAYIELEFEAIEYLR
ncbi:hypothetical protein TBR22_A14150 [Luteitalea sp. TBR-22]|nr:hypothetical protein TBR22_A14150 [Luteitalea sp. TBR-22]